MLAGDASQRAAIPEADPQYLAAIGSQVLFGTGKARHDDHTLAIYEAAGFTGEQADQAAASVFTFVLGNALGPAAAASLTRKLSSPPAARPPARTRARHPATAKNHPADLSWPHEERTTSPEPTP
jgi:hypothetical protein